MFIPDNNSLHWLLEHWQEIDNETTRQAVLMMMHENYQAKRIPNTTWMNALLNGIHCEKNPLIASTLTNYLSSPLQETSSVERDKIENELYRLSYSCLLYTSDVYKRQIICFNDIIGIIFGLSSVDNSL